MKSERNHKEYSEKMENKNLKEKVGGKKLKVKVFGMKVKVILHHCCSCLCKKSKQKAKTIGEKI